MKKIIKKKSNLSNKWLILKHGVEKYIVKNLEIFVPPVSGDYKKIGNETLNAANLSFPLISKISKMVNTKVNLIDENLFCNNRGSVKESKKLKKIFNSFKTDKSNIHNYHLVYSALFKNKNNVKKILEIGIGTNNTKLISNMGQNGIPGASLRAFKYYFRSALVYGADIDKNILFQEKRIKTYHVDQTKLKSLDGLFFKIGKNFDLIVDDGLHAIHANLNIIITGLKNLKKNGWLVIEDIPTITLPIWKIVYSTLSKQYKTYLIKTKNGMMFLVNKNK